MKYLLMTATLIAGISPAMAGEATITVPDTFKVTMAQTQAAFERCLGATVAHTVTDQCNAVANVLAQLAGLNAVAVPQPTPSPSPTPAQ